MTERSKIIFLHGASSSGKSTLAKVVQDRIELPFWHISIDHLRDSGVLPTARIKAGDFNWKTLRTAFFNGFHASLAAYADAGNNLIVEHILDAPGWQADLARLLHAHDMFFVGLHCPLPELIRREQARGDRPVGSAEQDFNTVHRHRGYDLELQALDGIDVNMTLLLAAWGRRAQRSRFFEVMEC